MFFDKRAALNRAQERLWETGRWALTGMYLA
jgi:hypothetical protein